MEYLSPQGVLLLLVYGTTASPLWLELRGRSAWQVTPSWTVYRLACHRLHPWLRVMFAMVPHAAWPGSDQQPWSTAPATGPVGRLGRPSVSDPWGVGSFLSPGRPTCVRCPGPLGSCSPMCPLAVLCCVCGVLGPPAPVHRCARSVWCVACAVSWASGSCSPVCPLGVLCCVCGVLGPPAPVHRCARSVCCVSCAVSWALGSCSPVCPLGVLCCVCGVLGLPAPVHRCARSVCCVACAVSWASGSCSPVCPLGVLYCVCGVLGLRLLFTGVPARCGVLRVRCPGPPAPVHRCARSVCCVACAVSWASRLRFTGVPARCVVLRMRCPGPPAPVRRCARSVCCVACAVSWAPPLLFTGVPARCGVLRVRCPGPPAPVHRCARSVCCVACAVSWASRLLFTDVPARCVVLRVRCPGPPGSCSPVCPLGVVCCVCGVLGLPAPVHRCARSVCCVACAVSWASGSCSPVCPLGVLCCVCGVLGPPAPVHRCARSVCCVACAVSWASGSCSPVCPLGVLCCVCGVLGLRLLFTGVPARCGVLRVRCPGPPAPVHRCARSVCCVACAVSWASRLLFTGVPARCVVLRVRYPGPPAPVHRFARSVCCVACAVSWAPRLLFSGVPARCVVLRVRCPGPPGSCSPVCLLGVLCCVCGVLGLSAPVHRCARSVCCGACAVSWAPRLLFSGVPARCVVLRVRCPGPPGSCSPVCPLGVFCCLCGVLGLPASVHRCARSVCCVACAVSWASGSCSPVCPLGVVCCVCGVLGPPAPVHRCARSVCCVACAVSWASRLLFTGVPARCVVLRVRCPGPLGSCSPVCPLAVLCCVCGVLGPPAPVHRCACSVCCFACAVSWASRLLFTGVPARCVVLRVRCPGPPGSCSPVCLLGVLCCVCGVLGLPAPVHRCARSVCCVACAVSWASRLLFTGVPARCVVLRVRCPGPPGSCSPVCPLGVLCCVCGVLGPPAPVHRCARSLCCVACAVSWPPRLLFTGVPARCVLLRVRCPGPPGSCSPVCPLVVLCCVCGVLGLRLLFTGVPARCVVLRVRCPGPPGSCSPVCPLGVVCCVCGVLGLRPLFTGVPARCVVLRVRCPGPPGSCSPVCPLGVLCCVCGVLGLRLLFTGVPARCVVLRVRCPGPPGSCSPVCPLGVLCCVCGVLGLPAPVHRCARSVCCVACAVSWASRLLFAGVPARCVVLRVRCPGPPGSCSPVCPLGVVCCVCGVLGLRLLFTAVPARCVVLRVRCPGPPGSCSPMCPLGVLCCVWGVLGLPAPVHRCARAVCCVACAVSWASRLLFTGVPARCVVLRVRCPGPPGSCSPVCPLGVLCCVCGVLGPPAPVHRCARSVWCVACAVSWASGSCSPVCPLGVLCCVCGVLGLPAP